jgi:hypothetical protein
MFKFGAEIRLPQHWDRVKVAEAFGNARDNEDIVNFFGCANLTAYSRLMKPVFPDKPAGISYLQYVKTLLEKPKMVITVGKQDITLG